MSPPTSDFVRIDPCRGNERKRFPDDPGGSVPFIPYLHVTAKQRGKNLSPRRVQCQFLAFLTPLGQEKQLRSRSCICWISRLDPFHLQGFRGTWGQLWMKRDDGIEQFNNTRRWSRCQSTTIMGDERWWGWFLSGQQQLILLSPAEFSQISPTHSTNYVRDQLFEGGFSPPAINNEIWTCWPSHAFV